MPGTTTWTGGANDGNFGTAGNWSTSGGSTPPGAGDTVIIDSTAQDITLWPASVTLAAMTITAGYTGSIQSAAGAALTIAGTVLTISRTAGGAIRIAGSWSTGVKVLSTGSGAVYLMTTGTSAQLDMGPGTRVIVDGNHIVTNYENDGGSLDLDYSATAVTLGETYGGGRTLSHRAHTTARSSGGSYVRTRQKGTTAIAVVTVRAQEDSVYAHESSGTITTAHIFPRGHLTPQDSPFAFTISTLQERPNSKFTERSSTGALITVTTRTPVALP